MTDHDHVPSQRRPLRIGVGIVIGLTIFIFMLHWGGTPPIDANFILGVIVFGGLTLTLALAIWYLYGRQQSAMGAKSVLSPATQQFIAVLLMMVGLVLTVSLFWDELWHRRYGSSLQDFYWPPHLMLYGSILIFTGLAGFGLYRTLRKRGTLRQRFQSEPALGLIGLISLFFLVSIPSDEFWHRIYGDDLSAWSLPHLTLLLGASAILLGALAVQRSLLPLRAWRWLRGISFQEWICIGLLVCAYTLCVQIMVGEWDAGRNPADLTTAPPTFWSRPEWLFPVLVMGLGSLMAYLSLFAMRQFGIATLIAGLVVLLRWGLIMLIGNAEGYARMTLDNHMLLLLPALVVDASMGLRQRWLERPATQLLPAGLAALVFLAAGLPLIDAWKLYPRITPDLLLPIVLIGVPIAFIGAWIGRGLGQWLSHFSGMERAAAPVARQFMVMLGGALVGLLALIVTIVAISPPPIGGQ